MPESNATPSTAADVSDAVLSSSRYLTRQEVIRRRSRRVKQLSKCYRAHYWSLMQELKIRYREYYWKYGRSAFQEDEKREGEGVEGTGENLNGHGKLGLGLGIGENGFDVKRCAVSGCKSKAMALTRFCHPHILSDSKQKLYKGCSFVIKRFGLFHFFLFGRLENWGKSWKGKYRRRKILGFFVFFKTKLLVFVFVLVFFIICLVDEKIEGRNTEPVCVLCFFGLKQ